MPVAATEVLVSRRRFVAAGTGAFAGIGFVRAPAGAARFTWKYANANAADHPVNVAVVQALDKIREETSGDLDIKPFVNSALGGDQSTISQIRLGALELLAMNGGTLDTVAPVASIESVAFAFSDHQAAFNALDGDLGRIVRASFPAAGFIALDRVYENGFRYFTSSTKPIHSAEDLSGMKFRVLPGKLFVDTFRSLGTIVTSLDLRDLYVALQTHLVDGQETPLTTIENIKLFEVQKYCSLSHHMWSGYWILVNRDKWQSLPRNFQDIVARNINAQALAQRRANVAAETQVRQKLQAQGLIFNDIDAQSFKAKLVSTGYYGRWRDEFGSAAWAALEKYSGPLR